MKITEEFKQIIADMKFGSSMEMECEFCKKIEIKPRHFFTSRLSNINNRYIFCSDKCFREFRIKNKGNLNIRGKLKSAIPMEDKLDKSFIERIKIGLNDDYIEVNCTLCNKVHLKQKSNILRRLKKGKCDFYCSHKCAGKGVMGNSIEVKCYFCKNTFSATENYQKNRELYFCNWKCQRAYKSINLRFTTHCAECNKEIVKMKAAKKNSKSGNHFCNKSCKMKFALKNKLLNLDIQRSRAEIYLENLLKTFYPKLEIITNDRNLLNGLEIDILIPEIKLGIELNGPLHYFPIFGLNQLSYTQDKDLIKIKETELLKYNLLVVDISALKDKNREKFLNENFHEKIKPIIDSLLLST